MRMLWPFFNPFWKALWPCVLRGLGFRLWGFKGPFGFRSVDDDHRLYGVEGFIVISPIVATGKPGTVG